MRKHAELQQALASPVPSIRTPFTRDGEVDTEGLRNYVERCIGNGAKALMLTYGDSLYSVLTDDEVAQVTKTVVEQSGGRAAVIAADRMWWTGKTVEFARYCRELGADILMVLPPDWAASGTPETLVEHYSAVAREIPVMMVTNYLAKRGDAFGLELVGKLYRDVEGVVAVKDDVGERFGRKMTALVCDRWTVIAGGQKQFHLYLAPYGCQGYLSCMTIYSPEITRRYWGAVQAGDHTRAAEIVRALDMPFFEAIMKCRGGFDAGLHGLGELVGICERWRRPPYYSLNDAEMEELAESMRSIGVL